MSRISRYRKVLQTLAKYGFEDVVSNRSLFGKWKKKPSVKEQKELRKQSHAQRIRMVLQELGPTYIKFGQILSNRRDLLPPEIISELEKLQEGVEPMAPGEVEEALENELAEPRERLFRKFDPTPLASASMAQVHRAELYNGDKVVVKVQRPGIKKMIAEDIQIMRDVAGILVNNFSEIKSYQPYKLIETFQRSIAEELNFNGEAANINRFRKNFEDDARIYVPKVYRDITTDKVLVMEEIKGTKISDKEELRLRHGDKFDEIAGIGTDLYYRQVFEHGFFHADPHPGNIYILDDARLCFLDFGMMGNLIEEEQDYLADLMIHMSRKNVKRLSHTLQRMAIKASIPNERAFERDLYEMLEMFATVTLNEVPLSERIQAFKNILKTNHIELSWNYYLLMRALVVLEGVAEHLDPAYNVFTKLNHYARELILKKYDPIRLTKKTIGTLESGSLFLKDLPGDAKAIIKKMKEGHFQIEFKHQNLGQFYKTIDIVSNRVAFSILVAALIIGSSLIVLSNIPPYVFGNIPVIGFIGFLISGVLAMWLVISILRHGNI